MDRTHPLEDRLNRFSARWRRLLWVRGSAAAAGCGAALFLAASLCDYLWRSDDATARILLAAAAALGTAWALYRFLVVPLRRDWSAAAAAAVIEQKVPALRHRLLSAVEFLSTRADDLRYGSEALRRAAVEDAASAAAQAELSELFDRRPVVRAVGLFAAAAAAVLLLVFLWPRTAAVAALRLLQPWAGPAWPRQTELCLGAAPNRVARGATFEVEITAASGTRLPGSLRVWVRDLGDETGGAAYDEPLSAVGGVAVWRRLNVQHSFAFRVEGGDDRSMPWREVEVVAPVQIVSVSIRLDPPEYSGLASIEATALVRSLAGTAARVSATVDRPVSAALLHWPGTEPVAAAIDSGGTRLTFPAGTAALRVLESGPYWFDLIDADGVECLKQQRGEVIAVRDEPPQVRIEQPQTPATVVAGAALPVRVAAQDDLGLRRIGLRVERSAAAGTGSDGSALESSDAAPNADGLRRPSAGPPEAAAEPRWIWTADGAAASNGPNRPPQARTSVADPAGNDRRRTVEFRLATADFALSPGDELLLSAVAEDGLGQRQTSEPVRVAIISEEQWTQRIGIRLAALAGELQRGLRMQQACRSEVLALQRRLAADPAAAGMIERLEAADAAQRQVRRAVADPSDGAAAIVRSLLDDAGGLDRHRPMLAEELRAVGEAIDRIDRLIGGQIAPSLIGAAKAIEATEKTMPDVQTAGGLLNRAADAQAEVIALLQAQVDALARDEQTRRAEAEVSEMAQRQRRLWERTRRLGAETVGRSAAELPPGRQRELAELGDEQRELARRFEQLIEAMERQGNGSDAAQRAKEAARQARARGTIDLLRQAAAAIGENRLGQAADRQENAAADMDRLAALLADRPRPRPDETAAGRGAEQAAALKQWLALLRERQEKCLEAAESLFGSAASGVSTAVAAERRAALAAEQQRLADELLRADATKGMSAAAQAVASLLAERMSAIAAALNGDRPGAWIVARQREVLALMARLIDVAEQAAVGGAFNVDASEGGAAETGGQRQRTAALSSADVLLMLELQRDLAARTNRLDQSIGGRTPSSEQRAEMASLASEQARLNEMAVEMLRRAAEPLQ